MIEPFNRTYKSFAFFSLINLDDGAGEDLQQQWRNHDTREEEKLGHTDLIDCNCWDFHIQNATPPCVHTKPEFQLKFVWKVLVRIISVFLRRVCDPAHRTPPLNQHKDSRDTMAFPKTTIR